MALDLTPINITADVTAKPDVSVLTENKVDGEGIFDVFMSVIKKHLLEEYNDNRITGREYSEVYLGALDSALKNSIAFIDSNVSNIKSNAEIGLIRQKIVTELSLTDDDIPTNLGFNNGTTISGLNEATKLNTQAQTVFTEQKTATELAQTADSLPANFALNPTTSILGAIKSGIDKTNAEKALLEQKTATELSQTSDTIPAGTALNPTTAVQGVARAQTDLYIKQKDGFDRDAEQKLVKMMIDTWTVRRTTDTGTTVDANGLNDAEIMKVLDVAKLGIGTTPSGYLPSLNFDAGANEIVVGDVIQGVTSGAQCIVNTVVVSSGDWATNDAAGYVTYSSPNGTAFINDEDITSARITPTVHAVVNEP